MTGNVIRQAGLGTVLAAVCAALAVAGGLARGAEKAEGKLVVTLADAGAEAAAQCPVLVQAALPAELAAAAKEGRLRAVEIAADGKAGPEIAAQFQPASAGSAQGLLGFFPPAGGKGPRQYQIVAGAAAPAKDAAGKAIGLSVSHDEKQDRWTLMDGERAILCYNFAAVPVPPGVGGQYAVARSDYIHPMFGPGGEVLTFDYSKDHPHHRGLYWAWPETYWKGQVRDLHALQGVFARPVKIASTETGPVWASLTAENRWMWADKEPIVHERATIRAFAEAGGRRCIDMEFTFTAMEDSVILATRGQHAYGGFNLRFSARQGQKIVTVDGKPDASPRVSAGQIVGTPPGGQTAVAVVILQRAANPCYPGQWVSYPNLNWLQPTFPTNGTKYPLDKDKPLVLRYRLVIQAGEADQAAMRELWSAYNRPAATVGK